MYLLKNLLITSTILFVKLTLSGCTKTSTACYGGPGLSCAKHELSCPSRLVIQIINTLYGYRPECNDIIGLSNCINTTCCNEEPGDCFIPFSSDEHQEVLGKCNGVETCELRGLRRYNTVDTVCNGRIVSAYSKVEYDCVSKDKTTFISTETTSIHTHSQPTTTTTLIHTNSKPSTTTTSIHTHSKPTTTTALIPTILGLTTTNPLKRQDDIESSNVGSIVGGIFGAIIIILIIIAVVVFLYKRRKGSPPLPSTDKKTIKQAVTPHYHVIDGPGIINSSKDISEYDEIELDNKPKVQATHPNSRTTDNRKPILQTTDNYDHVGDDKLKVKAPKELDNYNHVGTHDHSVHEDNYNHIGNNPSVSSKDLESDYNHINGVFEKFHDEDEYNHIGNNLSVSSKHLEGDYNHINGVFETDEDDYNHFGNSDNSNDVITDDNYHHIGSGDIKVEGDYDHI